MNDPRPGDGQVDADRALAGLLRHLARDVAHELRGPVQSVVVNLEVLRRRAAKGQLADVQSRSVILEEEVRRLHGLADAFVGLLRSADGPTVMPAETMLAVADPLVDVVARARRVRLERGSLPPGVLVRVLAEPVALAILRIVVALCDDMAGRGTLIMTGDTTPDSFTVSLELRPAGNVNGDAVAGEARRNVAAAMPAAMAWLDDAGGTAALEEVSDMVRARVLVTVPLAT